MKNTFARLMAVAAVAGSGLFALPAPAHAWLGDCQEAYWGGLTVSGYCEGGRPSFFQEVVVCRFSDGHERTEVGTPEWAGERVWSVAKCGPGSAVLHHWLNRWE